MKTLVATVSAVVLGLSSMTFADAARADSFSIVFPDAAFAWSDDEYRHRGHHDTPIYIVNNGWSTPRGYYRRHYDRDHRRHGHRHEYKRHRHDKHAHHKRGHDKHRW